MAHKIGVVSQKGGVGKSTLARSIACEFAKNEWEVLIADMDASQSTSTEWNSVRIEQGVQPPVSVQQFSTVDRALKLSDHYELIIFDGAPHATKQTLDIARNSDFILLPTGISRDDQNPQIRLAHEFVKHDISPKKFAFAFIRTGASEREMEKAREYLSMTGYQALKGSIPEKDGYRIAIDEGKALTETPYKTLNEKADSIIGQIVKYLKL